MEKTYAFLVLLFTFTQATASPLANKCPSGNGFRLLPSTAPAQAVIVGYIADPYRLEFFNDLVSAIQKHQPNLTIAVLALKKDLINLKRIDFKNKNSIHPIPLEPESSSYFSWPQDFMSLGITGEKNQAAMLIHPYDSEAEIEVQEMLAKKLQMKALYAGPAEQDSGNTLGGNIVSFPGGVVAIGSDVDKKVLQFLGKEHHIVNIDTSWLPAGHVDELFTAIPNNEASPCNYTILYASPKRGLQLLQDSPDETPIETAPSEIQDRKNWHPANCLSALGGYGLPLTRKEALACDYFAQTNKFFNNRIQNQLQKIKAALSLATRCENIKTQALPILFKADVDPTKSNLEVLDYSANHVQALNANPVNMLVLNHLAIVPKQPNTLFAEEIKKSLAKNSMSVEFINTQDLHIWGGEAHCATNVIRACE